MVENITLDDKLLATIISNKFNTVGIHFITPSDLSQQVAYMHHKVGKIIKPHLHNTIMRQVSSTQEVLFIKKGKMRVDFYNDSREYLESRVLEEGDTILLVSGGHGFEVLEELEMIEVKQGPYAGENDKILFDGVKKDKLNIKDC